jgi:hypothetical protein
MLLPDIIVLLLALRWSDSDRAAAAADWVEDVRLRAANVPDASYSSLARDLGATFVTLDRGCGRFGGLRVLDPLAG